MMAHATKRPHKNSPAAHTPTQATGKATPAPEANGHSQPATPPAKESRIIKGVIEHYEHGKLVSREEPKLAAKPKPAPTPTPAKAALKPTLATALKAAMDAKQKIIYVGKLGTDDIWEFKPIDLTDPSQGVHVAHYKGYEPQGKTVTKRWHEAERLFDDMLTKSGFTWIDGVKHKLVDEDA
jgi:hypothetical protein